MRPITLKKVPVFLSGETMISDRQLLDAKELLRPDEVADILRISKSQVYEMIASGALQTSSQRPVRVLSGSVRSHLSSCKK
jgi:predicted DNA-binding transcriptional regulator AlpA